jgi:hypothetical protein
MPTSIIDLRSSAEIKVISNYGQAILKVAYTQAYYEKFAQQYVQAVRRLT